LEIEATSNPDRQYQDQMQEEIQMADNEQLKEALIIALITIEQKYFKLKF